MAMLGMPCCRPFAQILVGRRYHSSFGFEDAGLPGRVFSGLWLAWTDEAMLTADGFFMGMQAIGWGAQSVVAARVALCALRHGGPRMALLSTADAAFAIGDAAF